MQRRAAAAYVVFFFLLAAGAYGFIAVSQAPTVSLSADDAQFELQAGQEVSINNRVYTVDEINQESPTEFSAVMSWVNESQIYTATWGSNRTLSNARIQRLDNGTLSLSFPETTARRVNVSDDAVNITAARVVDPRGTVRFRFSNGSTRDVTIPGTVTVSEVEVSDSKKSANVSYWEGVVTDYMFFVNTEQTETIDAPGDTTIENVEVTDETGGVTVTLSNDSTRRVRIQGYIEITGTEIVDDGASANVTYFPYPDAPAEASVLFREVPDEQVLYRNNNASILTTRNGSQVLVPVSEWEPLDRESLGEGEMFLNGTNATTVDRLEGNTSTFRWTYDTTKTVELTGGSNVTLNGERFLAFMPDGSTLYLSKAFTEYNQQVREQNEFHERMNGFWGIVFLSTFTAILLTGLAFLPRKET